MRHRDILSYDIGMRRLRMHQCRNHRGILKQSLNSDTTNGHPQFIDKFPHLIHKVCMVLASLDYPILFIDDVSKLIQFRFWYKTVRTWTETLISNSGK